jgi:hypothetical protein
MILAAVWEYKPPASKKLPRAIPKHAFAQAGGSEKKAGDATVSPM